jgi:phosphoribosyl 1,2-cyclic phosphodiesterase
LKGTATPAFHSDPDSVGFRFETRDGVISYIADTELREGITDAHKGARVLILATTRPLKARIPNHLSTEDAAVIAGKVKPEIVFITHLGKKMLKEGPRKQALWIQDRSGVRTFAAEDDMRVLIRDSIDVISKRRNRRYRVRSFNLKDKDKDSENEGPEQ